MNHILPDHIWIFVLIVHTLAMLLPNLLPDLCFCSFGVSRCGLCWTSWPSPCCARADHATKNCSYHKRGPVAWHVFSIVIGCIILFGTSQGWTICAEVSLEIKFHTIWQRAVLYPLMTRSCMVKGHGPVYSTSTAFVLHTSMYCSTQ
jgi:hypothetical protein